MNWQAQLLSMKLDPQTNSESFFRQNDAGRRTVIDNLQYDQMPSIKDAAPDTPTPEWDVDGIPLLPYESPRFGRNFPLRQFVIDQLTEAQLDVQFNELGVDVHWEWPDRNGPHIATSRIVLTQADGRVFGAGGVVDTEAIRFRVGLTLKWEERNS